MTLDFTLGAHTANISSIRHAPLAQLAEQLTLNQRVRGSSPWRRTTHAGQRHHGAADRDGSHTFGILPSARRSSLAFDSVSARLAFLRLCDSASCRAAKPNLPLRIVRTVFAAGLALTTFTYLSTRDTVASPVRRFPSAGMIRCSRSRLG